MYVLFESPKPLYHLSDNRFEDPKPKRDPTMPKQPLSSYFLFSQEERLKVKAENPSYSICECAKELGRRWAVVSPEAKQRFQQMAEQARQKYDQDMAAHRQANPTPPAQSQKPTNPMIKVKPKTKGESKPKPKRDPNMPKRPPSSYFLFSQEERLKVKAENPSFSIGECSKVLGQRWAVLSPEEKQRFQELADQARQKYDQDMAAYRYISVSSVVEF